VSGDRPADYLASLVHELCALPRETEWVEFKVNEAEPQAIGEYISALANAAALVGKAFAYLAWGVRDEDHAVVGTTFEPHASRVGNEELESWLLRLLEPRIDFRFFTVEIDGKRVVLLEIARAARHPVRFSGQEFIRVGTYRKKLLGEAVEAGLIVIADPKVGTRNRSYLPFWAAPKPGAGGAPGAGEVVA
jgi:ATP-dependent DNA helicase RecG